AALYVLLGQRELIQSVLPYGKFVEVLAFISLGAVVYAAAALVFGAIRISDLKGLMRRKTT
ncbi:MAG: hypothetical protein AAFP81_07590, partial [Pseudomonadota bacterium]